MPESATLLLRLLLPRASACHTSKNKSEEYTQKHHSNDYQQIHNPPAVIGQVLLRNKILLVVGIIAVVAVIAINAYSASTSNVNPVNIPEYQLSAPSATVAPSVIVTSTRIYYAAEYTDDGETVILTDFFTYDSKKWDRNTVSLPLPREFYGDIKIYER